MNAYSKTKSVDDTEDGLRAVQFLMTCSEDYLAANPSGLHSEDAERLWYKGMAASNEILRTIEGRKVSETRDPAEAQQRLIVRESVQRLAKENGYIIHRAVQYHTIQTLLRVYEGMKASGVRMESAVEWLNRANLSRKQTGIWELTMDGSRDDGNFVVVRELGRKDAYFGVAGFGVFGPSVTLSDDSQIDANGWYGASCKVKVTAEEKTFNYGCDAYLSGQVKDQMVKDLRGAIDEAIVRRENERTAQRSSQVGTL